MIFIRKATGVTLLGVCASLILSLIICSDPRVTWSVFYEMWVASFFFIEAVALGIYLLIKDEEL